MNDGPPKSNSGAIAEAVADSLAAVGLSGGAIISASEMTAASLLGHVREAARGNTDSLVVVVQPDLGEPDRTMLIAAITPIAIELAPTTRLSLIDMTTGSDIADVIAAAGFLAGARSTTGQVLRI